MYRGPMPCLLWHACCLLAACLGRQWCSGEGTGDVWGCGAVEGSGGGMVGVLVVGVLVVVGVSEVHRGGSWSCEVPIILLS